MNSLIRKLANIVLNYQTLTRISGRKNYPLVQPMTAIINVTSQCNSRCVYCNIWREQEAREARLPGLEDLRSLALSMRRLGVRKLCLSGGEPLLRADLEDIIALFRRTTNVSLVTNGILLSGERLEQLIKSGLKAISLSLDTFDPHTYLKIRGVPVKHALAALDFILAAQKSNPRLICYISCVVSRYNIGSLTEFAAAIHKYGHGRVAVNFQAYQKDPKAGSHDLNPSPEMHGALCAEINELIRMKRQKVNILNTEDYLRFIPEYLIHGIKGKKFSCTAGFTSVSIDHNLDLHPCFALPAVAGLHREDLAEVWFSGKMKTYREKMLRGQCPGCTCVAHLDRAILSGPESGLNKPG